MNLFLLQWLGHIWELDETIWNELLSDKLESEFKLNKYIERPWTCSNSNFSSTWSCYSKKKSWGEKKMKTRAKRAWCQKSRVLLLLLLLTVRCKLWASWNAKAKDFGCLASFTDCFAATFSSQILDSPSQIFLIIHLPMKMLSRVWSSCVQWLAIDNVSCESRVQNMQVVSFWLVLVSVTATTGTSRTIEKWTNLAIRAWEVEFWIWSAWICNKI